MKQSIKNCRKKRKHADNTELMVEINKIVSDYITIGEKSSDEDTRQFDISKIDFDLLRREFAKAHRKNLILKDLKNLVNARLEKLIHNNPSRVNFYERYKKIIDAYNDEKDRASIEKTFDELMKLANSLSQEEQRYVREEFQNDEQLAIYDMMFEDNLSAKDIKKIKEVSVELLEKVKKAVASIDHCFDKEDGQSSIKVIIRNLLYEELPNSVFDNWEVYQTKIFDYVKTKYGNYVA